MNENSDYCIISYFQAGISNDGKFRELFASN